MPNIPLVKEQQFFIYGHIILIIFSQNSYNFLSKMSALNKTESQIWRQYMNLSLHLLSLSLMFWFSDRTYGFWWDTVLIHKKGVLKLVEEQQFFTDSHTILVVQCFDYLLKTLFQNIAHYSLHWGWVCIFLIEEGVFPSFQRQKKSIYGYCTCLLLKGTFYFSSKVRLRRKSLRS